jgi:hypothetical protein
VHMIVQLMCVICVAPTAYVLLSVHDGQCGVFLFLNLPVLLLSET